MRIFLTGATGFLGAAIAQKIIEHHDVDRVYCLVRNSQRFSVLQEAVPYPNKLAMQFGDLSTIGSIPNDVDIVIHCAAVRNLQSCADDPEKTLETNVLGTEWLIEQTLRAKVKKFIYISSQSVYENIDTFPWCEDMQCAPTSVYAVSKLKGENVVRARLSGIMDFVILRVSRLYGTGMFMNEDNFVTGKFPLLCLRGEPLIINGSGEQGFDLLSIKDAAHVVVTLCTAVGEIWSECYNLASGYVTTVKSVATTFAQVSRELDLPEVNICYNVSKCDTRVMYLDISKIMRILQWRPQASMTDEIREIIEFYKTHYAKSQTSN